MTAHKPPAPFDAPWHGQAFALAVALSEAGHFKWSDWVSAFSKELEARGKDCALDGSDDYYLAWIATLERIVAERGMASAAQMSEMVGAWREAYLTTPHGDPVHLQT